MKNQKESVRIIINIIYLFNILNTQYKLRIVIVNIIHVSNTF